MYPNNIYVKNHEEIKKLTGDIGVQLDQYDDAHNLKHDALARAQYKHWCAQQTGVSDLLGVEVMRLLVLSTLELA